MKNCHALQNQTTTRTLPIVCATALAVALTVALPQPAHADPVTPPPVPATIKVPKGNKAFLLGQADGTQNYICLPCPNPTTPPATVCPSAFAWVLFTPQAIPFNDDDK
jgi:hypothetical protein